MMDQSYMLTKDRFSASDPGSLPNKNEIRGLLAAAPRPFVLANERELSVLRRGLTKDGWKRSLYLQDVPPEAISLNGAGLLSYANKWLATEIKIPERSGRYHDFFCDDGTRLKVPDDLTNPGTVFTCPECGRTYSGEKFDGSIRWLQHMTLAAGCLALAIVYQLDREPAYAEKAAEILRKYAEAYPGPHTGVDDGGLLYQSIHESTWSIPLAQAYDLIYHCKCVSSADRDNIENKLLKPIANGLLSLKCTGNWESWHLSAAGVIGCATKDCELLNEALQRFATQISDELGKDGIWPESIHTYHFWPLSAFVNLAEACIRAGIDLYAYQPVRGKSLKAMFLAPLNYAYPSFQLPAIKDGWYRSVLPLSLYEVAYRRWGDPAFAWVLKTGYGFAKRPTCVAHTMFHTLFSRSSLYAFLFGRDLPGRVVELTLASTVFEGLGVGILRSNAGTVITFNYGPFLEHGQRDKLSITLYANRRVLCADYGTPGYGASVTDYYMGTASHNTVMVDGKDQEKTTESALRTFQTGEYLQMVEADTREAYPGVVHSRRATMVGDIVVMQDFLKSDSKHTYDWLLRCEGELRDLPKDSKKIEPLCKEFTNPNDFGENIDHSLRWQLDDVGLSLWVSSDLPGKLICSDSPAETSARTVPVVDVRCESDNTQYLSLLVPYNQDLPSPKIERLDKKLYKITRGNTIDWIYAADAPDAPSGQTELESDARFATVREIDGEVAACGLYGGSYIKLKGEWLLLGAGPFNRVEVILNGRNPFVAFEGSTGDTLRLKCHSRAMRVNGHRISASTADGMATIRIVGVLADY